MNVACLIRRMAAMHNAQTGESIQETIAAVVKAVHTGMIDFENPFCLLCGSRDLVVTSTKTVENQKIRGHKCRFCGATFRSAENIPVVRTEEPPPAVEKPQKKRHTRNRR